MKQHYVYKIINTQTNQYYVGVRSTKNIKDDKYMGSSSVWTKDYIQINKEVLIKTIIQTYTSRRLANRGELEYLKIAEGDPLCVNVLYKRVPSHFGRKQSPEQIAKRVKRGKDHGMFGKHHTEEAKKKISAFGKGKPKSDEFKQMVSRVHKGKVTSEKTKQKVSATKKAKFASGELKSPTRSVLVEDLLLGTKESYNSLKTFCDLKGLNYGSLKVFARKQYIYKERYKVIYTSEFKIK